MEKRGFCTIVTADYLPYVYAIHESLEKRGMRQNLNVLITNSDRQSTSIDQSLQNVSYYFVEDLQDSPLAERIYRKYSQTDMDCLRWSYKPVFINFLLGTGYQKVVYIDSDIFFFNPCEFLFDELDRYDILLSPHWRDSNARIDAANFEKNFQEGIYNGGFVAASAGGKAAMEWWASACEYKCVKQVEEGFYVDQKYLDFLASKFPRIGVLSHRGCNLAEWNRVECARTLGPDNRVLINNEAEVVFIHFTKLTIERIILGSDPLLAGHLKEYIETLNKCGAKMLDMEGLSRQIRAANAPAPHATESRLHQVVATIKMQVRFRTRIRRFLQG